MTEKGMNLAENTPEILFTKALIQCPSVTPFEGGALDLLEKKLSEIGFVCERMKFSGDGGEDTDNLYARFGTGKKFFCFAGHTDVVPPGDLAEWKHPPFSAVIENGVLYGRGAADMKGAIAAFVIAVENFLKDHPNFQHSIALLITGDEEGSAINGTRKMVERLSERNERPDACIVGEPTNPEQAGQMIKVGRRGSLNAILTVTGVQGHVAYPHLANNPVHHLIDFLVILKNLKLDNGNEFFQPSNLEITSVDVGNPITNVIPVNAKARLNIRFSSEYTGNGLIELLTKEAENFQQKNQVKVEIDFIEPWGESFLTGRTNFAELLHAVIEAHTGRKAEFSTTGGTSDARFIKDLCPVIEYGTVGASMHRIDEGVAISEIITLRKIYQDFLFRFFA